MSDTTTDVVVIGGGVAGLSTAMQLALRGSQVVVCERQQIGNGSTGRAAGLLGQLRGTAEATRMLMDSLQIVRDLEERVGSDIFVQTGSLRVAATDERAREIADLVKMGQSIGFPIQHMSLADAARMLPCMKTDDLVDACYCPTDGHLRPAELVRAFMEVGQSHGVEYRSDTPVEQIVLAGGTVRGVKVGGGQIHAPCVVNAAGPWSYGVAGLAGAKLPAAALGHRYLTTRPDPLHLIDPLSPGVRDRHHRIYARPEGGGLIVGMYEAEPVAYDTESLPPDFDMSAMQLPRDDAHVAQLIRAAGARFPWITTETPMTITAGIMTFTPDGNPLCGQMPDVAGLFHCSGFSGHGMIQSPAIGLIMAQLILDGQTTYDLEAIDADRFFDMPGFQHRDEIKAKCLAMYASYYGGVEGQAQLGGWKSEVGRE